MSRNVVYFDHCQEDLVGALEWMLEMAKKGELISVVGVGAMEVQDEPDLCIATIRAGAWAANMFSTVGGLESMKMRLLVDVDENIQSCVKRLTMEP